MHEMAFLSLPVELFLLHPEMSLNVFFAFEGHWYRNILVINLWLSPPAHCTLLKLKFLLLMPFFQQKRTLYVCKLRRENHGKGKTKSFTFELFRGREEKRKICFLNNGFFTHPHTISSSKYDDFVFLLLDERKFLFHTREIPQLLTDDGEKINDLWLFFSVDFYFHWDYF